MRRYFVFLLVFLLFASIIGTVNAGDFSSELETKIMSLEELNLEEKQRIKDRLMEMILEGELDPTEVLTRLENIEEETESTEMLKLKIYSKAIGLEEDIFDLVNDSKSEINFEENFPFEYSLDLIL